MRYLIPFALSLVMFARNGRAQPVLDTANLPKGGVVFVYSVDTGGYTLPPPGTPPERWDLRTLTAHLEDTAEYLYPAATGFQDSFPDADYALYIPLGTDYIYNFFDVSISGDSGKSASVGSAAVLSLLTQPAVFRLTPPSTTMKVPFTYQDTLITGWSRDTFIIARNTSDFVDTMLFIGIRHFVVASSWGWLWLPALPDSLEVLRIDRWDTTLIGFCAIVFGNYNCGYDTIPSRLTELWSDSSLFRFPLVRFLYDSTGAQVLAVQFWKNAIPLPRAGFTASDTVALVGTPIQFYDRSSGATRWLWHFGDGNSSTLQHPVHTYADSGAYTVTQIVSNAYGSDTLTLPAYIRVYYRPVAGFTYSASGLTVTFTDTSKFATSWLWDFGDGNTSTQRNPVHTYPLPATYTVRLIASNPAASDTAQQSITVTVTAIETPILIERKDNHLQLRTTTSTAIPFALYDFTGKKLMEGILSPQATTLPPLPAGTPLMLIIQDGTTIHKTTLIVW